jgi:Glycosyl hydrolase family 99
MLERAMAYIGQSRGRLISGFLLAVAGAFIVLGSPAAHVGADQPVVRAAFYYPWYPNAWTQGGVYPYTNYIPSAGFYSSSDLSVIKDQIAAMQYGHVNAGIISWWGQGSEEDSVVSDDLAAANGTGFKWTLYYEPQGYSDPSVSQIESDLSYIKSRYVGNQNYLWIDGKPVIFVYAGPDDGCAMAQRWYEANAVEGFYTVLKVFNGYTSCAGDASSWHQYAPAEAEDNQQGSSFSISPGFYKSGDPAPLLSRNLTEWAQNVRDMVASGEPLQLITTFNEWGEGTAVESAEQWASPSGYGAYLDVMHDEIPMSSPGEGYAEAAPREGYAEAGADGGVLTYGGFQLNGSAAGERLTKPIVGMAATPDGGGYWLVASDGGVFSFGDAEFYGSTGALDLNKPIVGMAATPDGGGYWLVASDGGVFSFGDAEFYGSTGALDLNKPIVGMAAE